MTEGEEIRGTRQEGYEGVKRRWKGWNGEGKERRGEETGGKEGSREK